MAAKNTTNEKEKEMTKTTTTTEQTPTLRTTTMAALTKIATKHLDIETLETQGGDSFDFHNNVSVWGLKSALYAAFDLGRRQTAASTTNATTLLIAIRENLSPATVTSVAAHLRAANTKNPDVDQEVRWFADQLIELLGGHDAYARMMNELGV